MKPDIAIVDYYIERNKNDKTNGKKVLEKLREKYLQLIGFILSGKTGLPDENDTLCSSSESNFSASKKKLREGAHFYFFKNKAACIEIFDILSRISWKSSGKD